MSYCTQVMSPCVLFILSIPSFLHFVQNCPCLGLNCMHENYAWSKISSIFLGVKTLNRRNQEYPNFWVQQGVARSYRTFAPVKILFSLKFSCFTGKTTFIKHLLNRDYPGAHVGPEPTTDRFVVAMHGYEERRTPGNTLVVQPDKPYQVRFAHLSYFIWSGLRVNCCFDK